VAIGIDPSTSHFVFTANFTPDGVYGTVSDFQMDTTAGTLINLPPAPPKGQRATDGRGPIPHGSSQK